VKVRRGKIAGKYLRIEAYDFFPDHMNEKLARKCALFCGQFLIHNEKNYKLYFLSVRP
jgi:hypothetical protein